MTALSADRKTLCMLSAYDMFHEYPVAASTTIYAGSLVCQNAAGFVVPAAAIGNYRVIGMAYEHVDNSAGAAGAKRVRVRQGIARWANGDSITDASIGLPCHAVDDQTVDLDSAGGDQPVAGIIYEVETAGVWVLTQIGVGS